MAVEVMYATMRQRDRSANFCEEEKVTLAKLCASNDDINCKLCDANSLALKAKAWTSISNKFNELSQNGPARDVRHLQGLWKRMRDKYRPPDRYANARLQPDIRESSLENDVVSNRRASTDSISISNDCAVPISIEMSNMEPIDDPYLGGIVKIEINDDEPCETSPTNDVTTETSEVGSTNDVAYRVEENRDNESCFRSSPVVQKRKRRREPPDPKLEEHEAKMRIYQLKEWKLMHECQSMNIGLPPGYSYPKDTESSDDVN